MRAVGGGGQTLSFAFRRPTTVSSRYSGTRPRCPAQRRLESSSSSSEKQQPDKSTEHAGGSSETSATDTTSSTPPVALPTSPSSTSPAVHPASSTQLPKRTFRHVIRNSVVGRAGDAYSRAQDTKPYWTQFWSTIVIYFCGDLAAQLLFSGDAQSQAQDEKQDQGDENSAAGALGTYDPLRTLRHLTVGAVAAIPVYRWFMFLHRNFNFASRTLSIAAKVVVSQSVFTPVFNTYFFSAQSLLAGASIPETFDRLCVALPTSLINSAKLWPAVTALLFAYVDPRFRSVVSGVVAVGWQSYLSWLHQKATREVAAKPVSGADLVETSVAVLAPPVGAVAA